MIETVVTDGRTYKVVVAEDDDDLRAMIAGLLRERDYEVLEAPDGKQALALAGSERPNLVVLDLHMPHMGGWEVCRRLKSDRQLRSIPVIMMTADLIAPEDAEYGLSLGADEYIVKPFLREILLYNVERLLKATPAAEATSR